MIFTVAEIMSNSYSNHLSRHFQSRELGSFIECKNQRPMIRNYSKFLSEKVVPEMRNAIYYSQTFLLIEYLFSASLNIEA